MLLKPEMVYILQGSFYLGYNGNNSNNFVETGTVGTCLQIISASTSTIGSAADQLYESV